MIWKRVVLWAFVLEISRGGLAGAESFSLVSPGLPGQVFAPGTPQFTLEMTFPPLKPPDFRAAAAMGGAASEGPELEPGPLPRQTPAVLLTTGVLLGATASALEGSIRSGFVPFHADNEFWFGKHTYAGGADKASHFVFYNGLARELHIAYGRMGYPDDRAYRLAFATSLASGLITEIGNGLGEGPGFSYEDLIMDALGAGTAMFITKHGLDDVVGFRFGLVPAPVPTPCCPLDELGKDYSTEIYTADLKIAGFAQRLRIPAGPARFFLFSFTYGTKGYKHSLPEFREQQVGFEIGLNFPEILTALGVKDTTWWGRCLFIIVNFLRIPYTQIGYRYDVIHGKWYGPNVGQQYDPGPGN